MPLANVAPPVPDLIRVLIYEDNTPLREALTTLLDDAPGYVAVGAFGDAMLVERQMDDLQPDVVLMDIEMPGRNGIEAVRLIRAKPTVADILMLTVFDDDGRVFDAIRAGATGYLLKKTPSLRLLEAIREVYEGGAPISPDIARKVISALQPRPSERLTELTARENDVLDQLAKGLSYKLAAHELGISIDTLRTHVKRIYEKLHVHSLTEAIARLRGT